MIKSFAAAAVATFFLSNHPLLGKTEQPDHNRCQDATNANNDNVNTRTYINTRSNNHEVDRGTDSSPQRGFEEGGSRSTNPSSSDDSGNYGAGNSDLF